jgi:glutamate-ammonia-ligase adenylyltransferase
MRRAQAAGPGAAASPAPSSSASTSTTAPSTPCASCTRRSAARWRARHGRQHQARPGGIREIEFIAQVFQLIRGGRDKALQIRPTLQVLAARRARHPRRAGRARAAAAYRFLRNLEHRLQYLDDAQTHTLPESPADQALIAAAWASPTTPPCSRSSTTTAPTSAGISRRLRRPQPQGPRPGRRLAGLRHRGDGAGAGAPRLRRPRKAASAWPHPQRQPLPADAGGHPRALRRAGAAPDRGGGGNAGNPDATLTRGLDLIEAISRRAAYLALLQQYPQALQPWSPLVGASSWAATI